MSERDGDQGFQVRDRRRRSDQAGTRQEEPRLEADLAGRTARGAAREDTAGVVGHEAQRAAPSLVGLFAMLAGLAAAALEGTADPASGQARPDLAQASELIDLLILLREKTEGHRTPEESQTLQGLIYELQMKYVRAAAPPR
jgi:hypothetical protein